MAVKLSEESKRVLLAVARDFITSTLTGDPQMSVPENEELNQHRGVFITVHHSSELRGCIGIIEPSMSTYEAVKEIAYQAAFHDPRFPALTVEELPEIDIEISLLNEPKEVHSIDDINLGCDGIIMKKNGCKSFFLPQVPLKHGWDLETTLELLSTKAGLKADAWKNSETVFETFQAEHFSETELEFELV